MPTTPCVPQLRLDFQLDRPVEVSFDAPATSRDAGWLLLRALDDRRGTTAGVAAALDDRRAAARVTHAVATLARQRVFQIAAGYADANDATTLRHDPLLRLVCGRGPGAAPLASQPTLTRLEARDAARAAVRLQRAHEARWVAALPAALDVLVLDLDGTSAPTHGAQQLALFHGHYATTMYAPLLVFDQFGALASARLRPGNRARYEYAGPVVERLVRAVRAARPTLPIVVRGDAGFCHPAFLNRLLRLRRDLGGVDLVVGLLANDALKRGAGPVVAHARTLAAWTGREARAFDWVIYQSEAWHDALHVVARAAVDGDHVDLRFVASTLPESDARVTYERGYSPRGEMENRIKDLKRVVRADRLSCHAYAANAVRLQLHAAAYELLHALRAAPPPDAPPDAPPDGPPRARWQLDTLRLRLLKVAATVQWSARRVWIALPRSFPWAATFRALLAAYAAPHASAA